MLTIEEKERLVRYSVDSHRGTYSDAQLWALLKELKTEETVDLKVAAITHTAACSRYDSDGDFRRQWLAICNRLNANKAMIDLIAWHLEKRGDGTVSGWIAQQDARQRQLMNDAAIETWKAVNV